MSGSRRDRAPRGVSELARSAREGALPIAPRIAIAGIVGAILFGILVLRLWALTVLGGAQYAERADRNQLRLLPREAPRGKVLDRNGEALVANREAQQVVLDLQDINKGRIPSLLATLSTVLNVPVAKLQKKIDQAPPGAVEPVVLAGDVTDVKAIWYLQEHKADFPGIDVRKQFQRTYPYAKTAAHFLGQVTQVSELQLKTTHTDLKPGDRLGQSGVENTYDQYLRGTNGYDAVQVNAAGIREGVGRQLPATPGSNLQLTIDLPIQQEAEQALAKGINAAHATAKGKTANAGAVVVEDVNSGELLASVSLPSFDENAYVTPSRYKEVERLQTDKRAPLLDRTISGAYPPGSTYKAITSIAAMESHVFTPGQTIDCPPYKMVLNTKFKNHESRPLGLIGLTQALETSCDTFFYSLGLQFANQGGSDPHGSQLQAWSRKFGLDKPTGVDVPGEVSGTVPDPAWRKKTFTGISPYTGKPFTKNDQTWLPGFDVNLSIGQGDLLVTPLQMTNVFATVANGGTRYTPHFGRSIQDASGREQFQIPEPKGVDLNINPVYMAALKLGLVAVNNGTNGTATRAFAGASYTNAGKSGTAEKKGQGDMAWYCGYAPADKPEIAACAFIDGGGGGGAIAGPVIRQVFDRYFSKKHQQLMQRTATREAAAQ
jgi:penicillin-binding protein 2